MTVSGIVGSVPASGTASVPASAPASVSATATSGGTASTTTSSGGAGGGIGGGGVGWTPSTVSNVATASSISAANHQLAYDLRFVSYVTAAVIAVIAAI